MLKHAFHKWLILKQMWRYMGPRWLLFRAWYAFGLRSGLIKRRMPVRDWQDQPLAGLLKDPQLADADAYLHYRLHQAPPFFFGPSDRSRYRQRLVGYDSEVQGPVALAEALDQGKFRYFEHLDMALGFPPDWHKNPFTGQRVPANRHWSQIEMFAAGDIKAIWEASRFGFTYALVRAYWRTNDERYPDLFWRLVEDWQKENPPQQGPNWMCGQEISLRVMAWCFGLYGFLKAQATTPERVQQLAQMIAVSGERIAANINYALSQKNNHGISEGVGLWTIGLLFPELQKAKQWRALGRRVLEELARELIYDDGTFSQHSVNYHRLMLHDYLWAIRLGELNHQPLSAEVSERVCRAGEFAYQLQDQQTGRMPLCGANDGALILPLSNCEYHDYRPVIQMAWLLTKKARCFASGLWDEEALWLLGPEALDRPLLSPERHDLSAENGGYYTLRGRYGFGCLRCATFRHRPGDADQLHLDLWWRGQNMALDAGTYSYNAPAPWRHSLAETAYHNTVLVDDKNQMLRLGRFLWLPWSRGWVQAKRHCADGRLAYQEGAHDGYQRLQAPVGVRRGVLRLGDEHWLVVDDLTSPGEHRYRLHWLLADMPYEWDEDSGCLALDTPAGPYYVRLGCMADGGVCSLVRADEDSPRGWWSPYYSYRTPALSVDMALQARATTFWTTLGPEKCAVHSQAGELHLQTAAWQAAVRLETDNERRSLVASVSVTGAWTSNL